MTTAPDAGPSRLELALLQILWEQAPLSAEQVRERLAAGERGRSLAYSSVITVLNILVDKGFATRVKQGRAFVFRPAVERRDVNRGFVGDLVDRLFDGSPAAMMLELLDASPIDADELKQIQRLITQRKKELSE
ncbi:MAG: BlaI/MecI/CopY family transcriptional regulator [Pirellulaceae bacterium]|jgi:predicted transcriptional regulator|nr:BlaI/MecI/CopY family transcriptional regulator [Pirellulaceae bacterium]